jgi:hypothetical protein
MNVSTELVDFLVLDSPSSFAVVILAGLDIYTHILRESSQQTRNGQSCSRVYVCS